MFDLFSRSLGDIFFICTLPYYVVYICNSLMFINVLLPNVFSWVFSMNWLFKILYFCCDQRRIRQSKTAVKSGDGGMSSAPHDQNNSRALGQQLLLSLAPSSSGMSRTDANDPSSGQLPPVGCVKESRQSEGQDTGGQLDTANAVSQVLSSPEINGLLSGFSEQTGVGSPDVLRNMLQQLTQSPQIMNTVNQIAQQIEGQDLGNIFSGFGGQAGGIDLSRMVQQMMPVVSQALGHGSAVQPISTVQHAERRTSGADSSDNQNFEVCMPY